MRARAFLPELFLASNSVWRCRPREVSLTQQGGGLQLQAWLSWPCLWLRAAQLFPNKDGCFWALRPPDVGSGNYRLYYLPSGLFPKAE